MRLVVVRGGDRMPVGRVSGRLRQGRLAREPFVVREIDQLAFQLRHRERLFGVGRIDDVGTDPAKGAVLRFCRSRTGRVEDIAEMACRRGRLQPVSLGLIGQAVTQVVVVFPQFVAKPDHGKPPSTGRARVTGGGDWGEKRLPLTLAERTAIGYGLLTQA